MIYKDEYSRILGKIYAQCHRDPEFKKRFLDDPKAFIKDEGIQIPDTIKIEVIEETDPKILTLHLPPKPSDELSDRDLEEATGGKLGGTERDSESGRPSHARHTYY